MAEPRVSAIADLKTDDDLKTNLTNMTIAQLKQGLKT